jgi:nucleoside-diphosphate-sugar epimerase
MEVLITGGNGFVGRHLIPALQGRGDHVRVLSSPRGDTTWLEQRDVAIFRGDVRDADSLQAAMRGAKAVIHLVADTRKWGSRRSSYAVNVAGVENVCGAALAAGVGRLIHISTFTVYDMAVGRPVTEDDSLAPLNEPYSTTKAEGDRLVQRLIAQDGLPAVIFRLGALIGPGDDRNFGRLADRVRAGAVPFVDISDVVRALVLALDSPRAPGQVYNIGNDQPLSQQQYLTAIAEHLGAEPPHVHVPYHLVYAAAYGAERVSTLSGYRIPPVLTRHGTKILGEDGLLSIDKARRHLGYEPAVPVTEAVRIACDWYVDHISARSARPITA